jgi:CsoR family transcriptional regulator, copper-sensing transcriptional repressor
MKMEHALTTNKQKALKLSRQASGILAKVTEMIDHDTYCPEVIQQVDAAIGLLKSTKKELLGGHLDHCLEHQIHTDKKKTVEELLKIYNLTN